MKKIFCVEDDLNIRELISYALSSSGFEVCGFENSMDFSEGLKKDNPDLILLDIMLPDKDGTEILKELKSDKEHSDIPVIVLTAKSQQLDKIRCLDGGADDYIVHIQVATWNRNTKGTQGNIHSHKHSCNA